MKLLSTLMLLLSAILFVISSGLSYYKGDKVISLCNLILTLQIICLLSDSLNDSMRQILYEQNNLIIDQNKFIIYKLEENDNHPT